MKQKIQCPNCEAVFEIEMQYGKEVHDCPSCGVELDVTAVFNDLGEALSITTVTLEKGTEHIENIGRFNAIDESGVKEIARMQEYITNLENLLWRIAMFAKGKDKLEFMPVFTERGSREDFCIRNICDFIKKHNQLLEEIENLFTESDDVDDIIYSYSKIEEKIKEHRDKKEDKKWTEMMIK